MNTTIYPIKISVSNKQHQVKDPSNFEYREIYSESEFLNYMKFDHVFSELKDGYRSRKNFLRTKLLWGDVDNTHSEIPDDWVTIESFREEFKDYNWILYTSKSHGVVKDGKQARDKFHVVFPLDREIEDGREVKELLVKLYGEFKPFDGQVKDQTHFFIGTDDCCKEYLQNKGGLSIEEYIKKNQKQQVEQLISSTVSKNKTSSNKTVDSFGKEGSRNSNLTSMAGFLRSKFGCSGEDLYEKLSTFNREHINPKLTDEEVRRVSDSISGYPTNKKDDEFWTVDDDGKPQKIIPFRLTHNFLRERDFGVHVYDEEIFNRNINKEESGMEIVKKDGHVIQKYGGGRLEEYIHDYLEGIGRRDVREIYDNKATPITNKQKISIGRLDIEFFQDEKDACYLFFKNGVVKVTKDNIEMTHSINMDGKFIWESQIIPREIDILSDNNWVEGDFEKLVKLSMSQLKEDGDEYNDNDWKVNPDELKSLMTAYGALISNYKSPESNKVFLFIDSEGGDKNNGRTGKSLIMNSIGEYKKHAQLNGKDFNNIDSFNWDQVDTDTRFVILDDVRSSSGKIDTKEDFCFVDLYSRVTGTFTVNKKYGSRFTFPPDTSPKLGITTNKALTISESSSDARINVVEFHPYWNRQDKKFGSGCIKRKFGKSLLSQKVATGDWDNDDPQWNYFYNFGFRCIQEFLREGLYQPERTGYRRKQLLKMMDEEVLIWIEKWLEDKSPKLKREEGISLEDLFDNFKSDGDNLFLDIKKKNFKEYLREVCNVLGYEWNPGKKMKDGRWQRTVKNITGEYIFVCPNKERRKELELRKLVKATEEKSMLFPWEK